MPSPPIGLESCSVTLRVLQSTQLVLCGVAEGLCEPKTSAKLLFSDGHFWSRLSLQGQGRNQGGCSCELNNTYLFRPFLFLVLIKLMKEYPP